MTAGPHAVEVRDRPHGNRAMPTDALHDAVPPPSRVIRPGGAAAALDDRTHRTHRAVSAALVELSPG